MNKLVKGMAALLTLTSLVGCGVNGVNSGGTSSSGGSAGGACTVDNLTLPTLNEYLNTVDMENANPVAVIEFTHVNGPRVEWDFYALINFEYEALFYTKYQVTFLSCTCRSKDVNFWSTMYVELSKPGEDQTNDDIKIRTISFDEKDGYIVGFWGDSGGVDGHDINGTGIYYKDLKRDYIPYLIGKDKKYMDSLSVVEDIKNPDGTAMFDQFTGASVSTNNIIRILHSVMDYHADKYGVAN